MWKMLSAVTFGVTFVASYYFVRRLRARYVDLAVKRRQQLDLEMIRESRRETRQRCDEQGGFGGGGGGGSTVMSCVVCLSNPREVVLLDCGHVCLCADCLQQLQQPISCPVCRERVVRCLPLFNV